jgi:hypothetical protein
MKSKAKKTSIIKKSVVDQMSMTRIPNSDLAAGYLELGPNAFKLMMYFYSKGDGWVFDIAHMEKVFNLSNRSVKEKIKELEDRGFLLHFKGDIDVYIVGKKLVQEYT